jgi:hypothetical protein
MKHEDGMGSDAVIISSLIKIGNVKKVKLSLCLTN